LSATMGMQTHPTAHNRVPRHRALRFFNSRKKKFILAPSPSRGRLLKSLRGARNRLREILQAFT
jgi:hypothetical protein